MLTPFSSGVTPTASLKTNSSDQRMSPAFAGAQPLADSQTQVATVLPVIGLEPEALLVNVKPETATALNQTVLQTLAAVVAARMGVERLPDELLEAFFIRLAAAIEKKPLIEQGRIEARAGLKALQIPLSDLAPALRDPSGPVAARLTARAEAPMAAPQKTAADGITDSYLQTGSTPARSAETVAMGERNKLSTDSGNLLFQNAAPKAADIPADKASQTQLRTLFAPDAAGFERAPTNAASAAPNNPTPEETVARRGAGPVASGQESLAAAGPDLPEPLSEEDRPSPAAAAAKAYIRDAETEPTEFAMRKMPSASAIPERQAFPGKTFASSGDVKQGLSMIPQTIEPGTTLMAGKLTAPEVERLVTSNTPPLAPLAEFVENIEEGDLQKRLIHMLSSTLPTSEEGVTDLSDFKRLPEGKNLVAPKDPTEMAALRDDVVEPAPERTSRSRDVIGSTLLPAQTPISQDEVAQRAQAGAHFGVPFGYVTTSPAAEGYEAEKAEEKERRRGDQGAGGNDADADAETPEERRERLAREAVERLLQPEADAAPAVTLTRDASESDRAFAYYQRLAGF